MMTVSNKVWRMKVMSWNCRGATNDKFKRNAMYIINKYNPSIFIIIETKVVGEKAQETTKSLEFPKMAIVDANNLVGRI